MGNIWKAAAFYVTRIIGILGWFYLGVVKTVSGPVKKVIAAYMAGNLSLWLIFWVIVESFIYVTVAGTVWCIGYIASGYFRKG